MENKQFIIWLSAIFCVYLTAVGIDIMDADAAQYAKISLEMRDSGSYLQVYENGHDYLDKPPLLFWLSSLSMTVFGATNFAYKLPTLLAALLAIFSTYRFTLVFYKKEIAQLSALVLASAQALFLTTNDCRTDTLLMACIAFAFWHLAAAFQSGPWQHFLWGFVGIGLGMLTKGPVALIIPAMAFAVHFILKKEYKNFFRLEYLWGAGIIALVLLPMSWGLYQQFDIHPEKIVNGRTGVSGLRFFYWTQSFGRITGENTWQNAVYFTYLFESMFWSFAPWSLFFVVGYGRSLLNLALIFIKKQPFFAPKEYITLGGFTLGYISLASSQYQLPHYIFILYPLAAVIAAELIYLILFEKNKGILSRILRGVHWFVLCILWILPFLILIYTFPSFGLPMVLMGLLGATCCVFAIRNKQIVYASLLTSLCVNIFLNLYFYPRLLVYQAGSTVGRFVKASKIPENQFFTYQSNKSYALDFYAHRMERHKERIEEVKVNDVLLTDENGLTHLTNNKWRIDTLKMGDGFSVTNLTVPFLNQKTRQRVVEKYFLLKIKVQE